MSGRYRPDGDRAGYQDRTCCSIAEGNTILQRFDLVQELAHFDRRNGVVHCHAHAGVLNIAMSRFAPDRQSPSPPLKPIPSASASDFTPIAAINPVYRGFQEVRRAFQHGVLSLHLCRYTRNRPVENGR